ncbi:hypothetical protein PR048_003890 [Dryococelus australis]|uniref:Uncharacterized protein n=1 Tax=Dryococelus australis TaxID=614101 RepID=A0ABQ9IPF3_9NEOP|nr:hypothetical protein PR048_003890 [Dryococelus australis]
MTYCRSFRSSSRRHDEKKPPWIVEIPKDLRCDGAGVAVLRRSACTATGLSDRRGTASGLFVLTRETETERERETCATTHRRALKYSPTSCETGKLFPRGGGRGHIKAGLPTIFKSRGREERQSHTSTGPRSEGDEESKRVSAIGPTERRENMASRNYEDPLQSDLGEPLETVITMAVPGTDLGTCLVCDWLLHAAYWPTRRRWGCSSAGMKVVGAGDPRENPPTSVIVSHDSHMWRPGSDPTGNRTRFAQELAPCHPLPPLTLSLLGDVRMRDLRDRCLVQLRDPPPSTDSRAEWHVLLLTVYQTLVSAIPVTSCSSSTDWPCYCWCVVIQEHCLAKVGNKSTQVGNKSTWQSSQQGEFPPQGALLLGRGRSYGEIGSSTLLSCLALWKAAPSTYLIFCKVAAELNTHSDDADSQHLSHPTVARPCDGHVIFNQSQGHFCLSVKPSTICQNLTFGRRTDGPLPSDDPTLAQQTVPIWMKFHSRLSSLPRLQLLRTAAILRACREVEVPEPLRNKNDSRNVGGINTEPAETACRGDNQSKHASGLHSARLTASVTTLAHLANNYVELQNMQFLEERCKSTLPLPPRGSSIRRPGGREDYSLSHSAKLNLEIWAALKSEVLRADEAGDTRENLPTSDIARHDSHLGVARPAIEPGSPRWELSSLTAQPLPSAILFHLLLLEETLDDSGLLVQDSTHVLIGKLRSDIMFASDAIMLACATGSGGKNRQFRLCIVIYSDSAKFVAVDAVRGQPMAALSGRAMRGVCRGATGTSRRRQRVWRDYKQRADIGQCEVRRGICRQSYRYIQETAKSMGDYKQRADIGQCEVRRGICRQRSASGRPLSAKFVAVDAVRGQPVDELSGSAMRGVCRAATSTSRRRQRVWRDCKQRVDIGQCEVRSAMRGVCHAATGKSRRQQRVWRDYKQRADIGQCEVRRGICRQSYRYIQETAKSMGDYKQRADIGQCEVRRGICRQRSASGRPLRVWRDYKQRADIGQCEVRRGICRQSYRYIQETAKSMGDYKQRVDIGQCEVRRGICRQRSANGRPLRYGHERCVPWRAATGTSRRRQRVWRDYKQRVDIGRCEVRRGICRQRSASGRPLRRRQRVWRDYKQPVDIGQCEVRRGRCRQRSDNGRPLSAKFVAVDAVRGQRVAALSGRAMRGVCRGAQLPVHPGDGNED